MNYLLQRKVVLAPANNFFLHFVYALLNAIKLILPIACLHIQGIFLIFAISLLVSLQKACCSYIFIM